MPIRITCPSCSATLSVKDEYAGRAVKCPKCGGVIPPSQPAPPLAPAAPEAAAPPAPPAPPPAPEPAPFDELDAPAKSAKPGGKITGKPVARAKGDEDDDDDRPRRKRDDDDDRPRRKRDDDDEDDRGRSKKGPRNEDEDDRDGGDRPKRRKRDDDDQPTRGNKKEGGSSGLMIVVIICGTLLLCCGGVGAGVWWFVYRVKEVVEKGAEDISRALSPVNRSGYDRIQIGTSTRAQTDNILGGKGKMAAADDVTKALGTDAARLDKWMSMVAKNRAVIWQNGDDYLLVAFHPNAEADGRVMMKEWRPKSGANANAGESVDTVFLEKYPPPKAADDLSGPALEVSAEDLCQAYKDNKAGADTKYKDKVVLVEGKLEAIDLMPDGTMYARLVGAGTAGAGGLQARCVVQPGEVNKVYNCSRGQSIKLRGRCASQTAIFVDVMSCKVESTGPDPSVTVTAAALLSAYASNEATADEKYKEKQVTVTNATVESKTADAVFLVGTGKAAKTTLKIKVAYAGDFRKMYETLKPGDRIARIKGECTGSFDGTVYLNGAWLVP